MFKLIKYLIILGIIVVAFFAITNRKIDGKTVGEHAKFITQSKFYRETIKDIRTIIGESMKAVGEAISEDITEDDAKELQKVIKENINGDKNKSHKINNK